MAKPERYLARLDCKHVRKVNTLITSTAYCLNCDAIQKVTDIRRHMFSDEPFWMNE